MFTRNHANFGAKSSLRSSKKLIINREGDMLIIYVKKNPETPEYNEQKTHKRLIGPIRLNCKRKAKLKVQFFI